MNVQVGIQQVSAMTASTSVSVVDTYVCLAKISLVAYTGARWLSPPASISPVAAVTAQLQPLQVRWDTPPRVSQTPPRMCQHPLTFVCIASIA